MTAFDTAWDLLKALSGHKQGCELRLNGYYPHYSHRKYTGECNCDDLCVRCEKKPIWIKEHTALCFDCSLDAVKEGLIEPHPIQQFYLDYTREQQWRRDNA